MSPTNDDMVEALLRPIHQALENQGLTPTYLTRKLKRELNAKKTARIKVKGAVLESELPKKHKLVTTSGSIHRVRVDGELTEVYGDGDSVIQVDEIDWGTRQRAREDAHKLRGDYAPARHVFPDKDGEPQDITGLPGLELATKLLSLVETAQRRKDKGQDRNADTGTEDK